MAVPTGFPQLAKPADWDSGVVDLFAAPVPQDFPKKATAPKKSRKTKEPTEDEELESSLAEYSEPDLEVDTAPSSRKRKRKSRDAEDLEDKYFAQLENERPAKTARKESAESDSDAASLSEGSEASDDEDEDEEEASDAASDDATDDEDAMIASDVEAIVHESLKPPIARPEDESEKEKRTVFLGNVSSSAVTSKADKKTLLKHLASFIPDLKAGDIPHKVESIRFRSTAYINSLPKRAAFATKDLMEATTKSTNAYAVYSTIAAARAAVRRLNGTVVLDRHLRVDSAAFPARVDHKRCVFVGNLGFVDDDTAIKAADAQMKGQTAKPKKSTPGDTEEGLWRQFGTAGKVESVRVVRDRATRIGKGFAYVQFTDPNSVEAALLFNDKRYPPMLPRKLRVTRAKALDKLARNPRRDDPRSRGPAHTRSPRGGPNRPQGREPRGARGPRGKSTGANRDPVGPRRPREGDSGADGAFEGQRATAPAVVRGKVAKKSKKTLEKSRKRASAWRKSGGDA